MTKEDLKTMQSWSLERKIRVTQARIIEWYQHYNGQVYVSFSGGKDSTVLLDLARRIYSDIEAVYIDTGLEFPEIKTFVKSFDNVTIIRPEMNFKRVIEKYGYPIISKEIANIIREARGYRIGINKSYTKYCKVYDFDKIKDKYNKRYNVSRYKFLADSNIPISEQCCDVMKKKPAKKFEKETGKYPIIATMTVESFMRKTSWLRTGCNAFESKRPISQPMSFWTEQDVLEYLHRFKISYASVYGEIKQDNKGKYFTTGYKGTGCMFCGFGCHLEKEPNRFQKLYKIHPKIYNYCINGGEHDENGLWKPSKDGLGMGKVLDYIGVKYK